MPKKNNHKEIYALFPNGSGISENTLIQILPKNTKDPDAVSTLAMFKYFHSVDNIQDMSITPGAYCRCSRCGNYVTDAGRLTSNFFFMCTASSDWRNDNIDPAQPYLSRIDTLVHRNIGELTGILNSLNHNEHKRVSFVWPASCKRSARLSNILNTVEGIHCTLRGQSPDIEIHPGKRGGSYVKFYYKDGCICHTLDIYNYYKEILRARYYNLSAVQRKIYEDTVTILIYELLNEMFFKGFLFILMYNEINRFKVINKNANSEDARLIISEEALIKWSDYAAMHLLQGISEIECKQLVEDITSSDLCPDYMLNIDGVNIIKRAFNFLKK